MYYDRVLSPNFAKLLEHGGDLRWLFEFVKERSDLDFLIGKNLYNKNPDDKKNISKNKEWISVYRGLSRCVTINPKGKIDGADAYKMILPEIYGRKNKMNFKNELETLLLAIEKTFQFDRYYNNHKEGFYQNEFSRKYGILSDFNSEFVIIDKEVVIGYKDKKTKAEELGSSQKRYKEMQEHLSAFNAKDYGKNLNKKALGNELDFLALDKNGNVLLIEFKHGTNTSGIYLSPLQIGLYYDIVTKYYEDFKENFEKNIFEMLSQKQKIGLINPEWKRPKSINKIIPVLVISEYSNRSSAKRKYKEIMDICRKKFGDSFLSNIYTYNFTNSQLNKW